MPLPATTPHPRPPAFLCSTDPSLLLSSSLSCWYLCHLSSHITYPKRPDEFQVVPKIRLKTKALLLAPPPYPLGGIWLLLPNRVVMPWPLNHSLVSALFWLRLPIASTSCVNCFSSCYVFPIFPLVVVLLTPDDHTHSFLSRFYQPLLNTLCPGGLAFQALL